MPSSMPRAGSGWHYNLVHDLMKTAGAADAREIELFAAFDEVPLASASVAQVHAAQLKSGEEVVVKIIRPDIERVMRQDIALMYSVANLLKRVPEARRLRPVEVVRDYEATLFDELDLTKEAANTSQLKRNFKDSPLLFVPAIHWELTRRQVMVQERIRGVPVADTAALVAQGTDLKRLAERGVEIFFTQVFRDNFFHADMHPGNIFVSFERPHDPQYIAIDCGIVGSLTREDQDYLARNLLAFFHQDYYEVAALHIESGWVGEHTRANEFAAAIRTVCEPILEKPLKDISFGQVLLGLFQTARRFNMEPRVALLSFSTHGSARHAKVEKVQRARAILERDLLRVHFPRGERALDEARLPRADAHRFDGDVLFDPDRAVGRLDFGVDAGVLNHEVARGLDGELAVRVHTDLGPPGNDHRREIRLVGC